MSACTEKPSPPHNRPALLECQVPPRKPPSMTARKLFVTTALPYANGNFHIGHIMEYIQADTWVRAQRMQGNAVNFVGADDAQDRKSTRLNSSHLVISYAVFCL